MRLIQIHRDRTAAERATQLEDAAEAVAGFFELAEVTAAAGPTGESDLN